jgi:hypothetical protein
MKTTGQDDLYPNGNNRNGAGHRRAYRFEERATGLFLLGVILFNPLMLSVFDRGPKVELMGVPLLFVYVFCAWTLLIILLMCIFEARFPSERPSAKEEPKRFEPPTETP